MRTAPEWIDARGIASRGRDCLANMGIYLFNRDTLVDVLEKTNYKDFGRRFSPRRSARRHVQVHLFDGYWEDIGTIKSFFEANLSLATTDRAVRSGLGRIRRSTRGRGSCRRRGSTAPTVRSSLVADGCLIGEGAVIENSVIGLRCQIGPQRAHSQFDPDGQRLLRGTRRPAAGRAERPAAAGDRRRARRSRARSSTRTAASAATCGFAISPESTRPRSRRTA